ncbi:unnamed protein product, partial [Iphiclides podalirius]
MRVARRVVMGQSIAQHPTRHGPHTPTLRAIPPGPQPPRLRNFRGSATFGRSAAMRGGRDLVAEEPVAGLPLAGNGSGARADLRRRHLVQNRLRLPPGQISDASLAAVALWFKGNLYEKLRFMYAFHPSQDIVYSHAYFIKAK